MKELYAGVKCIHVDVHDGLAEVTPLFEFFDLRTSPSITNATVVCPRSRCGRLASLSRLNSRVGELATTRSKVSRTDIYAFQGFITLLEDLGDLFRQFFIPSLLVLGSARSLILPRTRERDGLPRRIWNLSKPLR